MLHTNYVCAYSNNDGICIEKCDTEFISAAALWNYSLLKRWVSQRPGYLLQGTHIQFPKLRDLDSIDR